MATKSYSCVIKVDEELREGEFWVLTSEDLPGLLLSGRDLDALRADTPEVIKQLFKMNYDMDVSVHPVFDVQTIAKQVVEPYRAPPMVPLVWSAVRHAV